MLRAKDSLPQFENVSTLRTLPGSSESRQQCHNFDAGGPNKQRRKFIVRSERWLPETESLEFASRDKLKKLVSLPYKDAGRSLRLVERERCPRAGARHLRSRAASGKRPAGIKTGLRLDRWTGTGDGGVTAADNHVPGSASGAERRRWFAAARTAVERR